MSVYFLSEKSGFDQLGKQLEQQRDSLNKAVQARDIKIMAMQRMLTLRNERIETIQNERDSIKKNQVIRKVYHVQRKNDLIDLADTAHVSLFTNYIDSHR